MMMKKRSIRTNMMMKRQVTSGRRGSLHMADSSSMKPVGYCYLRNPVFSKAADFSIWLCAKSFIYQLGNISLNILWWLNSISPQCFLLIPLKTENQRFSDVFMGINREHWEEVDICYRVKSVTSRDFLRRQISAGGLGGGGSYDAPL